ncbi:MAG: hypothetical protein JWM59_922 [Verrucomicrobiales bacterium]|nr:hypothetical protein [Verrucomicrobiales bacterium]
MKSAWQTDECHALQLVHGGSAADLRRDYRLPAATAGCHKNSTDCAVQRNHEAANMVPADPVIITMALKSLGLA